MAIEKFIQNAEQALEDNNFLSADKYIKDVLNENPKSLKGYLLKCTSELRQKKVEDSLQTSLMLIHLARERGKRDYICMGLYHAALAEFKLKSYKDAFKFGVLANSYDNTNNELSIFLGMVKNKLKKTESLTDVALDDLEKKIRATKEDAIIPETSSKQETAPARDTKNTQPAKKQESTSVRPEQKLRTDWYETGNTIDISLYVKRIDKESVKVEFKDESLSVHFKTFDGQNFNYDIAKLYSTIVPPECSYIVFGTKMELSLIKQEKIKWPKLEYEEGGSKALSEFPEDQAEKDPEEATPSYPTSSKKKIDWSKFDDKESDKEEEGDPALKFFQSLYANADEDTKRAMMKSYVESNGTSLSTDWSEVKKGKVKTVAPDGAEVKEWSKE